MADNSSKNKTQCFPLFSEANQDLGLHSFLEKTVPLSGFLQGEKKEDSFGVKEFDAIEAAKKRVLKGKALDPQSAMESEKKPPFRAKDLDFPVRLPLKIEVIDDTALIGSVPLSRTGNDGVKYQKKKKKGSHGIDEKKAKRSRKGKIARKVLGEAVRSMDSTEIAKKIMYSRKELEALRFANMEEQCNFWRDVYAGLAIDVTKEYEDLAHKNMARKATVPSTVGLVAGRGTRIGVNIFVH